MTVTPTAVESLALHHAGFVVAAIEPSYAEAFARSLGAVWDGKVIHDPIQKAFVTFLRSRGEGQPQIELVAPAAPDSPVTKFLERGGGLHHLCYEVADLDRCVAEMKSLGALKAKQPKPAAAFGGRRIAWMLTREKLLVELLERAAP